MNQLLRHRAADLHDRQHRVVLGWWSTPCGACKTTGRFEMPDGERVTCWECKGMAWVPAVLAAEPPTTPCAWCDNPATGTAEASSGGRHPSCGCAGLPGTYATERA